jgi:hypothetical protein
MIIRAAPRREYSALPNAMLRDKRLSIDTKGMLAYLNSLPRNWQVRPPVLSRHLSPRNGPQIGKERLRRMFAEAQSAGYMARSAHQSHNDDGTWGSYVYIVGVDPDLVAAEIAAQSASVAFLPQAGEPHAGEPSAANPPTYKRKKDRNDENLKTESPEFQYADASLVEMPQGRPTRQQAANGGHPKRAQDTAAIQHALAERLGVGDVVAGWLMLGELSDGERDQLTAKQRIGTLGDAALDRVRASIPLERAPHSGQDDMRELHGCGDQT